MSGQGWYTVGPVDSGPSPPENETHGKMLCSIQQEDRHKIIYK